MNIYEFSFPGKLFDATAVIAAFDPKEAKKILTEVILMNPSIRDFEYTIENIKFVRELGQMPKKSKLIYYFDGAY